ncbi:hypothetical protein GGF46_003817 [Coemansia sp. RSA 552]|nr:hypothetical protein GGF46_003817 [Coemansia sp. RSA 552]
MSLSRLPQVALRRLMPAITAVPKSLDDDQVKKMLEQQQQQQQWKASLLQSKSEFSSLPSSTQQGIISALAKSTASSDGVPSAIGRLLLSLSSNSQGVLSPQDLALIKAASTSAEGAKGQVDLLASSPEPASPDGELLLAADQEPNAGALDAASVDALVSALRGTAAISHDPTGEADAAEACDARMQPSTAAGRVGRQRRASSAREKSPALDSGEEHSDHDMPPISGDLSAAERRKEQNRRAQKKFRQKDKVRQKEIKWRASQYEGLVESNKRFKRDIDSISRERDMYRQILERNGIKLDDTEAAAEAAMPSGLTLDNIASSSRSPSIDTASSSNTMVTSPALPSTSLGMDQIAQDTFGAGVPVSFSQPASSMNDLLNTLVFGAVKADPMFGGATMFHSASQPSGVFSSPQQQQQRPVLSTTPSSSVVEPSVTGYPPMTQQQANEAWIDSLPSSTSDPLLMESPLIVDQSSIDPQYAQQNMLDAQFVDPMSFIDELLSTPGLSSDSLLSGSATSPMTVTRKRSYDDAMF